ncbi:hypothetical protein FH972_011842 [Carpinus fangiana]|uniref:DUF7731 domain-containing protein n=1 Tax=Carpinus fangiana TaxID=176857 RepID=A0A660KUB5_9ROSI|nr:hypothetical protein FH972_011842 [Carpinus fangiana]
MPIYVAANMLKHGFSTDQDRKDGKPDLSSFGNVNEIEYGMGPDEPPTSVKIKEQFQRQILYNMSPKEISKQCSDKKVLKDKGVVNVLANEVEGYCKPEGCRDHTLAVLKCIYDVKRDLVCK